MKVIITLSACFAVAFAAGYTNGGYEQQGNAGGYHSGGGGGGGGGGVQQPPIPIIKSDAQINPDGSYHFEYETGNGIRAAEQGYVKNLGQKDNEIQTAEGYFEYTSNEGIPIAVKYTADERGFIAQGEHLPTPPPIPKEIAESLANHQNDGDDGQYRADQHAGAGGNGGGYHQQQQQQQQHQGYRY